MVTPVESVEDLAKQTKIKYGVVRGGATQAFFEVMIYFSLIVLNCIFLVQIEI